MRHLLEIVLFVPCGFCHLNFPDPFSLFSSRSFLPSPVNAFLLHSRSFTILAPAEGRLLFQKQSFPLEAHQPCFDCCSCCKHASDDRPKPATHFVGKGCRICCTLHCSQWARPPGGSPRWRCWPPYWPTRMVRAGSREIDTYKKFRLFM